MAANQDDYVVRPLPNNGTRGYRLELDEFTADNAMVNLFLLALRQLQQDSLKEVNGGPNWLNYYALGAMHGRPTEDWNGFKNNVNNSARGAGARNYGYCHHDIDTFPTWHRPYMLLYETMIHTEMLKQAEKFPLQADKDKYLGAAARFRLPYWDLFMPRNAQQGTDITTVWGLPELCKREQVFLRTPSKPDSLDPYPNPMYKFVFPTDWNAPRNVARPVLNQGNSFSSVETLRTPSPAGTTDINFLNLEIQRQAVTQANKFWKMMSPEEFQIDNATGARIMVNQVRPWKYFANHNAEYWPADFPKMRIGRQIFDTVSLESWHDDIHVLVGQGRGNLRGQMGSPAVAAFEPLFWMHHNNIDRILSLYQALYAKNVDDPAALVKGLVPFMRNANRELWTSDDNLVKDYWSPGFGVPGKEAASSPQEIRDIVQTYLTDTYYWATTKGIADRTARLPAGWPKNLTSSEALNGTEATPGSSTPSAVRVVTRNSPSVLMITLSSEDSATKESATKESATKESATEDSTVKEPLALDPVLDRLSAIVDSLPKEVLATEKDGPSMQDLLSKPLAKVGKDGSVEVAADADAQKPLVAEPSMKGAPSESKKPLQIWDAHIKVRKFAFDGSFSVHVFIGWVKDDQTERYMTKRNEVGFSGIFARSIEEMADCENCKESRAIDLSLSDVIPLTTQLTDYLDSNEISGGLIRDGTMRTLPSLDPDDVVPFLREHLQWRMVDLSSTLQTNQEQEAQLVVAVTNRTFLPPDADHLMGVYGPETVYEDITNQKAGGLGFTYPDGTIVRWAQG